MIITDEILGALNNSKNILLHCHPSPDPDSVGSVLATKFALEKMGKNVTAISGDSDIPEEFVFPGVQTIIKKTFHEIDLNNFDTFVILDSGSKEMITRKVEVIFPEHLNTIVIDHHRSNTGYGKMNIVKPQYPSTAQLLYDIFTELKIEIDKNIALNLFMGMYTDTGGFRYENTNSDSFKIAGKLVEIVPEYSKTISIMENSKDKETLIFEGIAISNAKSFYNDILVISIVSNDELIKNNIKTKDISTSYISSKLKSIKTTMISATIVEEEIGVCKLSFRTKDASKYDVSKIAVSLGGGGHIAASGAILMMDTQKAQDIVVQKVKEIYNL